MREKRARAGVFGDTVGTGGEEEADEDKEGKKARPECVLAAGVGDGRGSDDPLPLWSGGAGASPEEDARISCGCCTVSPSTHTTWMNTGPTKLQTVMNKCPKANQLRCPASYVVFARAKLNWEALGIESTRVTKPGVLISTIQRRMTLCGAQTR